MSQAVSFLCAKRVCFAQSSVLLKIFFVAATTTIVCTGIQAADDSQSVLPKKQRHPNHAVSQEAVNAKAASLVKDALYYEISGEIESRNQLLQNARSLDADFAPALWHSGKIEFDTQWLSIEDVIPLAQNDRQLAAYEKQRDRTSDNESGNLQLAQWCAELRLDAQARAHFNRAIEFNPDNLSARAALGYRQYRGAWVSQAEFEQRAASQARRTKALNAWWPRISAIRDAILNDSPVIRNSALRQLDEIKDVAAIPALERAFSIRNSDLVILLIEKLSQSNDIEATAAIARQAIFSRWEPVRQFAATKLNGRPSEEYVPQMLTAMKSPVRVVVTAGSSGNRPALWETFIQEGQFGKSVISRGTVYYLNAKPYQLGDHVSGMSLPAKSGDATRATSEMFKLNMEQAGSDFLKRREMNSQVTGLNDRIMNCLALATGHTEFTQLDQWWDWWDQETEMQFSGPKPVKFSRVEREVSIFNSDPYSPGDDYSPMVTTTSYWHAPVIRMSCFAASTPVWTVSGQKPIESIKIGDLVLSQDADTGEVTFKPVMRTTIRPPVQILMLESSGQTLRCTGGHLFWVAGQGWTKARNLRSGQTLHCVDGTVQVSLVTEETQPEQTYNLVVADFNTYFVGPEKILSHDVTERKPTRSIVPGLARD
jgi:tetratricopeptide (TPR) repeat protein